MSRRFHAALLLAVLGVAGALRSHDLDRNGYWSDEFASLVASNGQLVWASAPRPGCFDAARPRPTHVADALPLPEIANALVADNHPPLYFVALRAWRVAWSDGETATRALSVLFSLLAIALLADAVRSLLGPACALWAALLLALALPDIALARETRSYSMLLALVLLAAAALARLEVRGPGKRRAVTLGLAALAAMLTHYFAAFPLAAFAGYAAVRLPPSARRQALAAFAAAAVVFLALWGPTVWLARQVAVANADWLGAAGAAASSQTWARLANLPARLLAGPVWAQTPGAWWPVLLYPGLAWLLWRTPRAWLFGALFLGTIGALGALDLLRDTRQLVVIRYVLPATPALCALVACSAARGRLFHLAPGLVAVALAWNVAAVYSVGEAGWRRFVRALEREAPAGETLVLTFRDRAMPLAQKAVNHYGAASRPLCIVPKQPSPLVIARLPQRGYFWLASDADPQALIPGARIDRRLAGPGPLPLYRMTLERP